MAQQAIWSNISKNPNFQKLLQTMSVGPHGNNAPLGAPQLPQGQRGAAPSPASAPASSSDPGLLADDPNKLLGTNKDWVKQMFGNVNADTEASTVLRRAGLGLTPQIMRAIAYGNQIEPQREAWLTEQLNRTTPAGEEAATEANRQALQAGALGQGQQGATQARYAGLGEGAAQNQMQTANTQANQSANDLQTYLASPEGQAHVAQLHSALLGQAQQVPGLQEELGIAGPLANARSADMAQSAQDSFGGQIGSILGPAIGAGLGAIKWAGLGSGGSGGGGGGGGGGAGGGFANAARGFG